ncbi:MAG: hypothetical protein NTV22_04700 [bacterium]|nr:hypothetical protein [bacterium]
MKFQLTNILDVPWSTAEFRGKQVGKKEENPTLPGHIEQRIAGDGKLSIKAAADHRCVNVNAERAHGRNSIHLGFHILNSCYSIAKAGGTDKKAESGTIA